MMTPVATSSEAGGSIRTTLPRSGTTTAVLAAAPVAPPRVSLAVAAPGAPFAPASNAATDGCTVRPAAAASARADESAATISIVLPRSAASRASSRKLIRDVASRDPYGSTSARRSASVDRIRAAADVISSSASR